MSRSSATTGDTLWFLGSETKMVRIALGGIELGTSVNTPFIDMTKKGRVQSDWYTAADSPQQPLLQELHEGLTRHGYTVAYSNTPELGRRWENGRIVAKGVYAAYVRKAGPFTWNEVVIFSGKKVGAVEEKQDDFAVGNGKYYGFPRWHAGIGDVVFHNSNELMPDAIRRVVRNAGLERILSQNGEAEKWIG